MRRRASEPTPNPDNAAPAARGWSDVFAGDSSRAAYEAAVRAQTPAGWQLMVGSQPDLLRLLVNRVPAELGVGVIFGLAVLFGGHPKGDDAGRAVLATALSELQPARARTLLVTLADAWQAAELRGFDERAGAVQRDMARATRRLLASELPEPEREALAFIAEQVQDIAPSAPSAPEIVPRERHAPASGFRAGQKRPT